MDLPHNYHVRWMEKRHLVVSNAIYQYYTGRTTSKSNPHILDSSVT